MTLNLSPWTKYAIVGVVNTFFYGFLIWFFLKIDFFSRSISVAMAFIIAMIFQYVANRVFTFRSSNLFSSEVPKYLVTAGLNYLLTLIIICIFEDMMGASDFITALFVTVICAATGYFLSLFWVFRKC